MLIVENEFKPTLKEDMIPSYRWADFGDFPDPLHAAVREMLSKSGSKIEKVIEKNFLKENCHVMIST